MIKKLKPTLKWFDDKPQMPTATEFLDKINELVDTVNDIQKEREAERFEIQEWIGILEAVRQSVNIHERQIDKLQMALESSLPDGDDAIQEVIHTDPYAEQRKWIGCVCRFWFDNPNDTLLDYLDKIQTSENGIEYYSRESGDWFPHCKPVSPDDDIIYRKDVK